jgi:hypothetical protein
MKYLLLFSFLAIFLLSCNCHHEGNGYVYDKTTKIPIANARVDIIAVVPGKDTISPAVFTNSVGYFSYKHNSCKDMVTIYKKNYIGHTLKDMNGDTIYLEYLEGN